MTTRIFKSVASVLVTGLVLVGAPSLAQAQERVRATVPFDFIVGDTFLPAGDYVVDILSDSVAEISSVDARYHALALTIADGPREDEATPQLTFTPFGGQYFLATVTGDESIRHELVLTPSNMARELAAMGLNDAARAMRSPSE